jgi:hypothetical protein
MLLHPDGWSHSKSPRVCCLAEEARLELEKAELAKISSLIYIYTELAIDFMRRSMIVR